MKRAYEIVVLSKGAFARTLRIFAPKKADRAIIMHDGQNVFYDGDSSFKKSWRALDALNGLRVKNTAIIGVDSISATRLDDYLPFPTELDGYGITKSGGKADAYADFIDEILIPYLDKRFGFKFYGMIGSSAGAAFTLYYAARKNARFRAYGMFSTPLFVSPDAFNKFFETCSFDPSAMYRTYVGGSETTEAGEYSKLVPDLYVDSLHTLNMQLRRSKTVDLHSALINSAEHDEINWRVPEHDFFSYFAAL